MKPETPTGVFQGVPTAQLTPQRPPVPPVDQRYRTPAQASAAYFAPTPQPNQFEVAVRSVLQEIEAMLVQKNRDYGNSIFEGVDVFARGQHSIDKICVRIDDKLSRIRNGRTGGGEDTVKDLAGYIVILLAAGRGLLP